MTWRTKKRLTTRLRGRSPILSCRPEDQPDYPNATPVLGSKGHFQLGWLRATPRNPDLITVIACEEGRMRVIGTVARTEGAVERAGAHLLAYHRERVKSLLGPVQRK
jgi:hypothetical protein